MPKKAVLGGALEDFETKVNELADEIEAIDIKDDDCFETILKYHEKYLEYFEKNKVDAMKKASQQGWGALSIVDVAGLERLLLVTLNEKLVEYTEKSGLSEDQKQAILKESSPVGKIEKLQVLEKQQQQQQQPSYNNLFGPTSETSTTTMGKTTLFEFGGKDKQTSLQEGGGKVFEFEFDFEFSDSDSETSSSADSFESENATEEQKKVSQKTKTVLFEEPVKNKSINLYPEKNPVSTALVKNENKWKHKFSHGYRGETNLTTGAGKVFAPSAPSNATQGDVKDNDALSIVEYLTQRLSDGSQYFELSGVPNGKEYLYDVAIGFLRKEGIKVGNIKLPAKEGVRFKTESNKLLVEKTIETLKETLPYKEYEKLKEQAKPKKDKKYNVSELYEPYLKRELKNPNKIKRNLKLTRRREALSLRK